MIRTGEMTPFGTVVKTGTPKPVQLSEFERQMMASQSHSQKVKKDFSKYLKKKRQATVTEQVQESVDCERVQEKSSSGAKRRKVNRFDERDWKSYDTDSWERPRRKTSHRIYHDFRGDSQLSDEEKLNK